MACFITEYDKQFDPPDKFDALRHIPLKTMSILHPSGLSMKLYRIQWSTQTPLEMLMFYSGISNQSVVTGFSSRYLFDISFDLYRTGLFWSRCCILTYFREVPYNSAVCISCWGILQLSCWSCSYILFLVRLLNPTCLTLSISIDILKGLNIKSRVLCDICKAFDCFMYNNNNMRICTVYTSVVIRNRIIYRVYSRNMYTYLTRWIIRNGMELLSYGLIWSLVTG